MKKYSEKTFKVNDNISIKCWHENTRYGFRHLAELYINGELVQKAKACYYNRTWESYEYQSVLKSALDKALKNKLLDYDTWLAAQKWADDYKESDGGILGMASMVAALGDILAGDKIEDQNNWKKRMLSTVPGIDFPEDWDKLPEEEKKRRLDGAIDNNLKK